jgi:hypothetical protein
MQTAPPKGFQGRRDQAPITLRPNRLGPCLVQSRCSMAIRSPPPAAKLSTILRAVDARAVLFDPYRPRSPCRARTASESTR